MLIVLTGIGFDKVSALLDRLGPVLNYNQLNFLHRMSARALVVLAWIHGGGRVSASRLTVITFADIQPR